MYIQIGALPENDFTRPLGLLGDCHRRVERFLGALVALAEEGGGPCGARPAEPDRPLRASGALDEPRRHALQVSLRYFREAAPNHTRDEEDSLFPRLRASGDPRALEALARLEELERDHREAEPAHAEVEALGQRWLADGTLPAEEADRLAAVLRRLAALYRRHIDLEDREVFPLAAEVLGAEDLAAVGREMAARRGL